MCHFSSSNVPPVGLPRWLSGEESTCQSRRCRRHEFYPWVRKITWSRKWKPTQCKSLENPMDRGDRWSTGSQRVRHLWVTEHSTAQHLMDHFPWLNSHLNLQCEPEFLGPREPGKQAEGRTPRRWIWTLESSRVLPGGEVDLFIPRP